MSGLPGRACLLSVFFDGGYVALGAQVSSGFTIGAELLDVTKADNRPWRKLLEGGTGTLDMQATGRLFSTDAGAYLYGLATSGDIAQFRFTFGNGSTVDAFCQVTSFEITGEYNGAQEYSISIANASVPTITFSGGGGGGNCLLLEDGTELLLESTGCLELES